VTRLESRGLNRTVAVLLTFFGLIATIAVFVSLIFPAFASQFQALARELQKVSIDKIITSLIKDLQAEFTFLQGYNLEQKAGEIIAKFSVEVVNYLTGAISTIVELFLVPFVAFFILKDGNRFKKNLIRMIPNKYFEMGLNVLDKIERQITGYIRGLVLEATALGIMSAIGSWILGIKFAFVIGLVAGIASFIPYLGAIIGAIPALIISLVQFGDGRMIIPLIIMFIIVHLIDDLAVQPLVYSHSVGMHPVEVVFVLLIFGELFGLFGMLIAIPTEAVIKVMIREIYWGLTHYKITWTG
jgi:predicted PurR-regulated permease PerM